MHTPAPWKMEELESNHNGYDWKTFTIRSPQNACLAIIGNDDRLHANQSQANARLIAAAPELLAILELAYRYLSHPDVLAITNNMALSGEIVNKRIAVAIKEATQ